MITVKVTITGGGKHYSTRKSSFTDFAEAMELVDKFLQEFPNGEAPQPPTPWRRKGFFDEISREEFKENLLKRALE